MDSFALMERAKTEAWSDEEVVKRVLAGDTALYEIIMRRHNQRLYRAARAILGGDTEAEDVMQETYVKAYQNLHQFAGSAKFSTWLLRIGVNEALGRRQRQRRFSSIDSPARPDNEKGQVSEAMVNRIASSARDPERVVYDEELRQLLESAVDHLPDIYRSVFVLRDVEELDTLETADCLSISEEAVKVRLHRARALLRRALFAKVGASSSHSFQFHARRCDRVVAAVFRRIEHLA